MKFAGLGLRASPLLLLVSTLVAGCAERSPHLAESTSKTVAPWAYDPTSVYDQKGLFQPRGFSIEAPNEAVDPFSGNLILSHTDLALPGRGGLDLRISRVYNSKIHRNYAALSSADPGRIIRGMLFDVPSPLGLGWTLHFGRLVGAVPGPNHALPAARYFERPDGSQHPFYQRAPDESLGVRCDAPGDTFCLFTKNFDSLTTDGDGHWMVRTVTGLDYVFGHTAGYDNTLVHYATEIRDANGNRIQIRYHDDTIAPFPDHRPEFAHFPDQIIDSLGRVIEFHYDEVAPGTIRLASISAAGRTYRYAYADNSPWPGLEAFLSSAHPPEGAPWRYEYAGLRNGDCAEQSRRWCELTAYETINGGRIEFDFAHEIFWASDQSLAARVVRARRTSGREVEPGTWSYDYQRGQHYTGDEHTTITRPDGVRTVYTYFGIGSGPHRAEGESWRVGLPLRERVIAPDQSVLSITTQSWEPSPAFSSELVGDLWIGYDTKVYLPRLREVIIERGGDRSVLTHTAYQDFTLPRCTTETGDAGTAYTVRSYRNVRAPGGQHFYALPEVEARTSVDPGPACAPEFSGPYAFAPDDEATWREYDDHGRLGRAVVNHVVTDFRYHPSGDLAYEVTYRDRDSEGQPSEGYCTRYDDYTFGTAGRVSFGARAPACEVPVFGTTREIKPDGSIASITDARGNVTRFTYDGVGRVIGIEPPGPIDPTVVTFDGSALTPSTSRRVSQGAFSLESRFDGFGREIAKVASPSVMTQRRYDALGRLVFEGQPTRENEISQGKTITYDFLDRTKTVTHANGDQRSYEYLDAPRRVRITDEAGRVTVHRYRAFGAPHEARLAWVQKPGAPEPDADQYTYTVGGRLLAAELSPGSRDATILYNAQKRVAYEAGRGWQRSFGYDAAGNLRCKSSRPAVCTDASWRDGVVPDAIRYELDAVGRTAEIAYGSPDMAPVRFEYVADQLVGMVDGVGRHSYRYTADGQIRVASSTVSGIGYDTEYRYDRRGNLEYLTYPSGRVVRYRYDAGNRLTSIDGFVDQIEYHPSGLPSRLTLANGVVTTLTPDARQRPDQHAAGDVFSLDYDFDAMGNVEDIWDRLDPNGNVSLRYDGGDRLKVAQGPWGSIEYHIDEHGDWTHVSRAGVETVFRRSSPEVLPGDRVYSTDAKGDLTTLVEQRGVRALTFDLEHRLTTVGDHVSVLGAQTTPGRYAYDGRGRAVLVEEGSGCNREFVRHYDTEGTLLAESTRGGVTLREYIVAKGQTLAVVRYRPLEAQPTTLDFDTVAVGDVSISTIQVTNHSTAPVTLDPPVIEGERFELLDAFPLVIPAGGNVSLSIRFQPQSAGPESGRMSFCADGLELSARFAGRGEELAVAQPPSTPRAGPFVVDAGVEVEASILDGAVVFGSKSGRVSGAFSRNGAEIAFSPSTPFVAGETISMTLPSGDGITAALRGRVLSARVSPEGGRARFSNAQTLLLDNIQGLVWGTGDLDEDGDVDLLTSRREPSGTTPPYRHTDEVWLNDGRGQLARASSHPRGGFRRQTGLVDVDGDGDLDLVAMHAVGGRGDLMVVENDGRAGFAAPRTTLATQPDSVEVLRSADLDADGDLDLLVAGHHLSGRARPTVAWWINDGRGTFNEHQVLRRPEYGLYRALEPVDLEGDGDLDALLLGVQEQGRGALPSVLDNDGAGTLSVGGTNILGEALAVGYIDGDGVLDLLVAGARGSAVKLGRRFGPETRFEDAPGGLGLPGPGVANGRVALGDLDADGDLDAVQEGQVYLNDGNARFTVSGPPLAGHILELIDLDADGDLDALTLVPGARGQDELKIWING